MNVSVIKCALCFKICFQLARETVIFKEPHAKSQKGNATSPCTSKLRETSIPTVLEKSEDAERQSVGTMVTILQKCQETSNRTTLSENSSVEMRRVSRKSNRFSCQTNE